MSWISNIINKIKVFLCPFLKKFAQDLYSQVILPGLAEIGREGFKVLVEAITRAEATGLTGKDKFTFATQYAKKHLNTKEVFPDDTLNNLIQNIVSQMKATGKL